jgi:carbon starvation protein CstA
MTTSPMQAKHSRRPLPKALGTATRLALSRAGIVVCIVVGAVLLLLVARTLVAEHAGVTRWALFAACTLWLGLAPVLAKLARRRRSGTAPR